MLNQNIKFEIGTPVILDSHIYSLVPSGEKITGRIKDRRECLGAYLVQLDKPLISSGRIITLLWFEERQLYQPYLNVAQLRDEKLKNLLEDEI